MFYIASCKIYTYNIRCVSLNIFIHCSLISLFFFLSSFSLLFLYFLYATTDLVRPDAINDKINGNEIDRDTLRILLHFSFIGILFPPFLPVRRYGPKISSTRDKTKGRWNIKLFLIRTKEERTRYDRMSTKGKMKKRKKRKEREERKIWLCTRDALFLI